MDELLTISNAIQKAAAIISRYDKVMVSISGGSDSDVMLDLLLKAVPKQKMDFVFFNTGIEYEVTKKHLDYLEKKYDIKINRVLATKPVPLGCREYGLPFLSKFISQMIERLQKHNFDFTNDGNKSYDELMQKYPKLKGALTWWCNKHKTQNGKYSMFNICTSAGLKEFLMKNPPDFRISDKCCYGAKKYPSKKYSEDNKMQLCCVGIRKSEGGIRSTSNKSCFDQNEKGEIKHFRPIFWFNDSTKKFYCEKIWN